MKVFIWVDMEGISGMTNTGFMYPENQSMEKRRLVTADVNAAIEGALEAGATTIYVNDAHPPERTILVEDLNPAAQIIPNSVGQFTLAGMDDSFDALFAMGLHAMPGTFGGFCDHAWDPKNFWEIRVNGEPIGEIGITAIGAAHLGVPMVLVTADRAGCDEARNFLGQVETVVTKEAISRYQARCYPPASVHKEIREKATQVLSHLRDYSPVKMAPPFECQIDMVHTQGTHWALMIPGCRMIGPRTIAYTAKDGMELLRFQLLTIAVVRFGAMDPLF